MTAGNDRVRSVNDRIRLAAAERGVDANRLRRSVAFQRLLARLARHGLVLKGGFCLEIRLGGLARTTKDVDVVGRLALTTDGEELREALEDLLAESLGDGFSFVVRQPRRLPGPDEDTTAWRIRIEALLASTAFEVVTLDVVGQVEEIDGATELLVVPPPLTLPGCDSVCITAVDVFQHAAEKLHAYGRSYAGDRPSSRDKDLVDLVLLLDADLLDDRARLGRRLVLVHGLRDGVPPPGELNPPPESWRIPYAAKAREIGLSVVDLDDAHRLVADLYSAALSRRDAP